MTPYEEVINMDTVMTVLKVDFKDDWEKMYNLFRSYGRLVYENGNGFMIAITMTCGGMGATLTSTFIGA
jgi:hypothetical protein